MDLQTINELASIHSKEWNCILIVIQYKDKSYGYLRHTEVTNEHKIINTYYPYRRTLLQKIKKLIWGGI